MKKPLSTALVIVLLLSMPMLPSGVEAATSVSGDITSNTTWSQSGSPYKLSGPVTVKSGVTLTIEPGVTVDVNNQYIQVFGTLNARGSIGSNIIFTSSGTGQYINFNTADSSSILENVVLGKIFIYIDNCSPKINNNTFRDTIDCALTARNGASIISNNVFYDINYYSAINVIGSQTVTNNRVTGSVWQYGIQADGNAYVANNLITGCWSAIKAAGNSIIEGNVLVSACNRGIDMPESCTATIKNNYIANNRNFGIVGGGTIEGNTVYNNTVGIYVKFSAIIKNNNIIENSQNSIFIETQENVNAEQNWWGTTNTQTIRQTIQDNQTNGNLGTVDFEPILTQANSLAPTDTEIEYFNANQASGEFSFYIDYDMQSTILSVTQTVAIALAIGWTLIGAVWVAKRFRVTRRNP